MAAFLNKNYLRNGTTFCLVFHHRLIIFSVAKLQFQTQPVDWYGTVLGGKKQ